MAGNDHNPRTEEEMRRAQRDVDAAIGETERAAQTAADEARRAASDLADEARARGEHQKEKAANSLDRVADELSRSAGNLDGNDRWAREILSSGADVLRSLSGTMHDKSIDQVVDTAQDYARRHPAPFLGSTIAAGFLLARMGKTAAARADEHTPGSSGIGRTTSRTDTAAGTGTSTPGGPTTLNRQTGASTVRPTSQTPPTPGTFDTDPLRPQTTPVDPYNRTSGETE